MGDTRIVITTGIESCLAVYPMSEWLSLEERVAALPQFDEFVMMLRRLYLAAATDCDVDKLGRVLIPATLRKHAGLERELMWTGMGRNMELWDRARFEGLRDEVLADPEKLSAMKRRLAELGL
jgi:MraZ protein